MRVMVLVRATKNSEAGVLPNRRLLEAMGKFNEELHKAGILKAGEGLLPSSRGVRVHFEKGGKNVFEGPFRTNEVVAGYWLWDVKSMDEAIDWVKRCPDPMPGEEAEIEIRPLYESADFGEELTPELKAQEDRLRDELQRKRA